MNLKKFGRCSSNSNVALSKPHATSTRRVPVRCTRVANALLPICRRIGTGSRCANGCAMTSPPRSST
jgi:hypothetical protein